MLTQCSEILDDRFLHHFRVYRDQDSGVVRFQATPRRGPMRAIPIWTAFVTQYIGERTWMKRADPTTVVFKQLRPYVFCEGYKLPKDSNGRYQLTFSAPEGMCLRIHTCYTAADEYHRCKGFHSNLSSHSSPPLSWPRYHPEVLRSAGIYRGPPCLAALLIAGRIRCHCSETIMMIDDLTTS